MLHHLLSWRRLLVRRHTLMTAMFTSALLLLIYWSWVASPSSGHMERVIQSLEEDADKTNTYDEDSYYEREEFRRDEDEEDDDENDEEEDDEKLSLSSQMDGTLDALSDILVTTKNKVWREVSQETTDNLRKEYLTGISHLTRVEQVLYGQQRMLQHCNRPDTISEGGEGNVPPMFQLLSVHVLIRHGARAPLFPLPQHSQVPMACHFDDIMTRNDSVHTGYLEEMLKLTRTHSKRLWDNIEGFVPMTQVCHIGQLTGVGALQLLKLGGHFKSVYVDKMGFFGDVLNKKDIHFRITGTSRTFQSAMAFLFGMFHSIQNEASILDFPWEFSQGIYFCSKKKSGSRCSCPMANRLLDSQANENYQSIVKNRTIHSDIKKEVAKILKTNVSKVPWVGAILDAIIGPFCSQQRKTNICSTNKKDKKCFPWTIIQKIYTFLDGVGKEIQKFPSDDKMHRLLVHPLLTEIARRIQNLTHGISATKFVLYSGHDHTITSFSRALGISDGAWPPFASRIVIELLKSVQGNGYFMKVLYNGENRTPLLRFCHEEDIVEGMCPLDNFLDFVFHRNIQEFKVRSYVDACAL